MSPGSQCLKYPDPGDAVSTPVRKPSCLQRLGGHHHTFNPCRLRMHNHSRRSRAFVGMTSSPSLSFRSESGRRTMWLQRECHAAISTRRKKSGTSTSPSGSHQRRSRTGLQAPTPEAAWTGESQSARSAAPALPPAFQRETQLFRGSPTMVSGSSPRSELCDPPSRRPPSACMQTGIDTLHRLRPPSARAMPNTGSSGSHFSTSVRA